MTFFSPRKFGGNLGVLFMAWKVWGKWGDFFVCSGKFGETGVTFFPGLKSLGKLRFFFFSGLESLGKLR